HPSSRTRKAGTVRKTGPAKRIGKVGTQALYPIRAPSPGKSPHGRRSTQRKGEPVEIAAQRQVRCVAGSDLPILCLSEQRWSTQRHSYDLYRFWRGHTSRRSRRVRGPEAVSIRLSA